MKVLFINPLLGGDFSTLDIGVTALITYLNERTSHKANLLDMTFHQGDWKKHIEKGLGCHKPDVITMSSNTMYMQYIEKISLFIKKHYDIPILLGGYHASMQPEETIQKPYVDVVFIGDGEYALTEYLNKISKGKKLEGIPGLWAKVPKKGIIRNNNGSFIKDIDSLPIPDWNVWEDLDKYFYYLGMLYFIGTRGCPYKCTNCDAHGIADAVSGCYYRIRNPEKYAEEIELQWEKYEKRGFSTEPLIAKKFYTRQLIYI